MLHLETVNIDGKARKETFFYLIFLQSQAELSIPFRDSQFRPKHAGFGLGWHRTPPTKFPVKIPAVPADSVREDCQTGEEARIKKKEVEYSRKRRS